MSRLFVTEAGQNHLLEHVWVEIQPDLYRHTTAPAFNSTSDDSSYGDDGVLVLDEEPVSEISKRRCHRDSSSRLACAITWL